MKAKNVSLPKNIDTQDAFNRFLKLFNGDIDSENLAIWKLQGTTSASADTALWFRHGLAKTPKMYIPIKGDVYIEEYGHTEVNVQSRKTDEVFELYLLT